MEQPDLLASRSSSATPSKGHTKEKALHEEPRVLEHVARGAATAECLCLIPGSVLATGDPGTQQQWLQ